MTEENKRRIALVPGANRGIGLETAKQLARAAGSAGSSKGIGSRKEIEK